MTTKEVHCSTDWYQNIWTVPDFERKTLSLIVKYLMNFISFGAPNCFKIVAEASHRNAHFMTPNTNETQCFCFSEHPNFIPR